jgi:hypothetical protein
MIELKSGTHRLDIVDNILHASLSRECPSRSASRVMIASLLLRAEADWPKEMGVPRTNST